MKDVVIIGGGISASALLYLLARYTDLKQLALIEKYEDIALVNSSGRNNSQTLHCGDIETNYTLEKAIQVRDTAQMVVRYCQALDNFDDILFRYNKMVIAVGEKECAELRARYETFKPHFPDMQLLEGGALAEVEPAIMQGRNEKILGLAVLNQFSTVNFQNLARSFVSQAQQEESEIELHLATLVNSIQTLNGGYRIKTTKGDIDARFVVVSAGGHSLLFAQRMGYGMHYSCLPVAGSFYYAPEILKGKVYTMQNEKLPFAAIHGDPDVLAENKTRLGPTALVIPVLERYNLRTFFEYLQVLHLDRKVMKVFWDLLKVSDIRNYIFKNLLFEVPFIRRLLFLHDARKVIPSLRLKDLHFAKKIGGVRPVMIDKENRKLHLGEAKINTGKGIIFNMTPSPGATSCLGNGEKDMRIIADYLGAQIDEARINSELK